MEHKIDDVPKTEDDDDVGDGDDDDTGEGEFPSFFQYHHIRLCETFSSLH